MTTGSASDSRYDIKWDDRAADYPAETDRPSIKFTERILKEQLRDLHSIVDLGCGPGNQSIPFARMFRKVYSVDSSHNMLDRLRAECERYEINNIEIVEDDCLTVELPETCQASFTCMCPPMFSVQGLETLERLSDDFCMFIGHLYEEDSPERCCLRELDIPFDDSPFNTMGILDRFRGDRDIRIQKFHDFPRRDPNDVVDRTCRLVRASYDDRIRVARYFDAHGPEDFRDCDKLIALYWHKDGTWL